MKTSNKILWIAVGLALVSAGLLIIYTKTNINFNFVKGNGIIVKDQRDINTSIKGIIVEKGIVLNVRNSDTASLIIKADSNLINFITTEINKQNELVISHNQIGMLSGNIKAYVALPYISSISSRSGARVYSNNDTLYCLDFNLNVHSGSVSKVNLACESVLNCSSHSGSEVEIKGYSKKVYLQSHSGSHIKASKFKSSVADIHSHSGSHVTIAVSDSLSVNSHSGAKVEYIGEPVLKSVQTNSGSKLERI